MIGDFILAFGPGSLLGGACVLLDTYRDYSEGIEVEGEVVEMETDQRRENRNPSDDIHGDQELYTVYCPVVAFSLPDNSTPHRKETTCNKERGKLPSVGESVTMTVRAGQPDTARRGTKSHLVQMSLIMGGILVVTGGGLTLVVIGLGVTGQLQK